MKLKTQIVLTTHLVLIVASLVFGVFTYQAARRVYTGELDARLLAAANLWREALPETYHASATDPQAVDAAAYRDVVFKRTRLAQALGVSHLWTLKNVDGRLVVTTTTRGSGGPDDYPAFYSEPEDVDVFATARETMRVQHFDAVLGGRRVRLAVLPFWADGSAWLSVAGMERTALHGFDRNVVSTVAVFCLLAMLAGMLVDFLLVRAISRPVENLTPVEGSMGRIKVNSGADEIRMLAENINRMSEAISTTVKQCREVEKSLRASEHKYRFLTEHTTDVIWSLDAELRIDYISPSDEKLRGFKAEEVTGRRVWEMVDPVDVARLRDRPQFSRIEWEHLSNGESRTYEVHLLRKDGERVLAEVTVTAYIDAAGEIKGYHGKAHDIRERRRLDEERSKVERLQSIGTLAGGIAHDFNNIMMSLFGNIELAKDLLEPGTHPYALLEEAGRSMSRAVRLTKQLLVFSKGGDPRKHNDVDIASLVEDVASFDLSGSNVRLMFSKGEGSFETAADNGQIEQVVSNIVINARQAMEEGGCIHLHVDRVELGVGDHPQLPSGHYIRVTIRDEGPGIPAGILKRIFEPYFTTKRLGSGLGLATAYSIIEKHEGMLEVTSEEGKGSTFVFHLPVIRYSGDEGGFADASADANANAPVSTTDPARAAGGVLVMDDEVLICALLKKMFTAEGVYIETVENADAAIIAYRQAFEAGRPFACVILDLTISGGIGGAEVVHELRKIDPDLFAIASSGYSESSVMSECRDHGFDTVIAKPYSRTEMLTLFKRIGVLPAD